MKKPIKLIALCVILLCSITTFAQDRAKQIEQLLSKYNEYGQFNGSALVAENGKVIFKKDLALRIWNGIFQMSLTLNSG